MPIILPLNDGSGSGIRFSKRGGAEVIQAADDGQQEKRPVLTKKQWIAGGAFILAALMMAWVVPTIQIAWVSAILMLTIYLFAFEVVAV
ncbi:MAG: hypothetical protein ABW168_29630, partial [Sedimenticola sp.]